MLGWLQPLRTDGASSQPGIPQLLALGIKAIGVEVHDDAIGVWSRRWHGCPDRLPPQQTHGPDANQHGPPPPAGTPDHIQLDKSLPDKQLATQLSMNANHLKARQVRLFEFVALARTAF